MRWLITGGTGSFGSALTLALLRAGETVVCFSRDPHRQKALAAAAAENRLRLRFILADITDAAAVCEGVGAADVVVHAAALKHVDLGERYPLEYLRVNVLGTAVVAQVMRHFDRPGLFISTDKAVAPLNLYGCCKALAERIWRPQGAILRLGNVIDARGSVLHIWRQRLKQGLAIPVRAPEPTRFLLTTQQVVERVRESIKRGKKGQILIPAHLPAFSVWDLAFVMAESGQRRLVPLLRGEKQHEVLLAEGELPWTKQREDFLVVGHEQNDEEPPSPTLWRSNAAPRLSKEELAGIVKEISND